MENANDLSSSLSFASNSTSTSHDFGANVESLSKLSFNLENLLINADYDYSDAEIVVEGVQVGVHMCILAARSQFFHEIFKNGNDGHVKNGKPRYLMTDFVPYGGVGYEVFKVFLNYMYTGKLMPSPAEVSTCVDEVCTHDTCPPAINYAVELMYASVTFQMKELVLLVQRRLFDIVEKALVEDVTPILVAAFNCQLSDLLSHCIKTVARSDLDSVSLEKELPDVVSSEIKEIRRKLQNVAEPIVAEADSPHGKRIKRISRIHKALDSDDVELVKLLLEESDTITLDDAYAIHYATAYCDPKVIKEVLALGKADLNIRNSRGQTVIHVAARRKEPSVLVALLTNGAIASATTLSGQTAVGICRRMTKPKDYNQSKKQGQEANKDRICIDVLEREMRRNAMAENTSESSHVVADDLHMRLDYLESRVAFARMLFPTEAKLAMEIANVQSTERYGGLPASKVSSWNLREVDLNEPPSVQTKKLQSRLQALLKTVKTGRHFFPNCSEVLDKFLEDDIPDVLVLENGTAEEQKIKKMRFMELKEDVQKAFYKDLEKNRSGLTSSSSSSSSPKHSAKSKVRKRGMLC